MAETLKTLNEKIEEVETFLKEELKSTKIDLTEKLDAASDDLKERLSEYQSRSKADLDKIGSELDSLHDSSKEFEIKAKEDVASIHATISTAKLIGVIGSLAVAFLGGIGANQIIQSKLELAQDQKELKTLQDRTRTLVEQHARMMKETLIDKIETGISSEGGIDNLKLKPVLEIIRRDASVLKSLNDNLPKEEQSNFFLIAEALKQYLADECDAALRTLERFEAPDQAHFSYAYMKGACYLRTSKTDAAQYWFGRAASLTQGALVQMSLNAEAASLLARWKSLAPSSVTESDKALDGAISRFENLTTTYPSFSAGLINLACAYSSKKQYPKVTDTLRKLRAFQTSDWIAERIYEDVNRPSDRYLSNYVNDELKVSAPSFDPNWKNQVSLKIASL
jgi:tetratricopeptide (TPR) repeat protein